MPDSKYFGIPFGASGDRATIPEATQAGGAVSYQQGFGPDYERNPLDDPLAKRVPRPGTNEFYYQVTNALKFLQLYGLPEWYQVDDNGDRVSYPLLARVRHAGAAYVSIIANNQVTPGTNPAAWALDEAFSLSALEATLAEMRAGAVGSKIATPRRVAEPSQAGAWNYAVAGGTANAWTATFSPAITTYTDGMFLRVRVPAGNTGAVTFNAGAGARPVTTPSGGLLQVGDILAGTVYMLVYSVDRWIVVLEAPRVLGADVVLYVRSDGSDANNGSANTTASAFRTIQHAVNQAQRRFISAGYKITIQVANGTYAGFVLSGATGSLIEVIGNTASPASVVLTPVDFGNTYSVLVDRGASLNLRGVSAGGGAYAIWANDRSYIDVRDCQIGNCSQYQLFCTYNSVMQISGGIRVSASGFVNAALMVASSGASLYSTATFTFVNLVAYSTATVWADGARIYLAGTNWVNPSNVGQNPRYLVGLLGLLYVAGAGPNFIPGTSAGVAGTGGLYA